MFTPQRKGWPFSSRAGPASASGKSAGGKGKGIAVDAPAPPLPVGLLSEGGGTAAAGVEDGSGDSAVWRQFREAGLLDEASLERRDREALKQKMLKLESEVGCF